MLIVACVLKSGGIYTPEWVDRLHHGVSEHLKAPHRFVCLSDVDVPCERIPLDHDWPGWWAKMEMFRLGGQVLYFDLDVAIVGLLDGLLTAPTTAFDQRSFETDSRLTAARDFYRVKQFGSSVMLFDGRHDIYERFVDDAADIMGKWRGDQEWLSDVYPDTRIWSPGMIASFKKHCRTKMGYTINPPESAIVVAFHGKPKMPDAPGWPQEYWAA
jgi:hypothetical protein